MSGGWQQGDCFAGMSLFDNHFHAEALSVNSVVDRKNFDHLNKSRCRRTAAGRLSVARRGGVGGEGTAETSEGVFLLSSVERRSSSAVVGSRMSDVLSPFNRRNNEAALRVGLRGARWSPPTGGGVGGEGTAETGEGGYRRIVL